MYEMKEIVEDIVKRLITIDTTQGKTVKGIEYLAEYLNDYGYSCEIDRYKKGEANLKLTVGPKNTEEFILSGHMDTVPFGDEDNWKFHQLSGKIVDGVMWGRGAVDMKGGVGALVGSFLQIGKDESAMTQQVTLAISSEEEVGLQGAKRFANTGLMDNASHLIIAEPTNLNVAVREKGVLWMKVHATGKQAHGSRPELGHNAIEGLAQLLPKLKELIPEDTAEGLGRTSMNFGTISGGSAMNVVAEKAVLGIDIRTVPSVSNDALVKRIEELLEKETYTVKYDLELMENTPAIENMDGKFSGLFVDSVKALSKQEPEIKGMYYGTDGAVLIEKNPVPFVIFGPGSTELLHQTNERLELWQLDIARQVIYNVVSNIIF